MLSVHYCIYTILGISSFIFIIEIVYIHSGISFLDFAFKKACKESSASDLSEVNMFNTWHQDSKRKEVVYSYHSY